MYKKALSLASGMLALALLVSGCGGSKTASPPTTQPAANTSPTFTTANPPLDLHDRLLPLSDLPAGWQSIPVKSPNATSEPSCFAALERPTGALGKVTELFRASATSAAAFAESLALYKNAAVAGAVMVRHVALINSCAKGVWHVGGHTFVSTVSKLSFPTTGDASSALRINFTTLVTTSRGRQLLVLSFDVIAVRKGRMLMRDYLAGAGIADYALFSHLTNTAAARLGAGTP